MQNEAPNPETQTAPAQRPIIAIWHRGRSRTFTIERATFDALREILTGTGKRRRPACFAMLHLEDSLLVVEVIRTAGALVSWFCNERLHGEKQLAGALARRAKKKAAS